MTREEIRATITGLERLARGECLCGDDRAIVRDALTLLREVAGDAPPSEYYQTQDDVRQVFADIDSERKAVKS